MRFAVLLAVALLGAMACTIDVGQPNIKIDCVEVVFPTEHVLYCDGGQVPLSPHDAGHDG